MSVPRFLFFARTPGSGRPRPEGSLPSGTTFLWRLVAGNNRLLGRSAGTYDDHQVCREAVGLLMEVVDDLVVTTAPGSGPGNWSWQLVLPSPDRAVLVASAQSYERQRESRYSIENFRACVPLAVVSDALVVRPRSLELPRLDRSVPRAAIPDQARRPERKPAPSRFSPAGAGPPLPPE